MTCPREKRDIWPQTRGIGHVTAEAEGLEPRVCTPSSRLAGTLWERAQARKDPPPEPPAGVWPTPDRGLRAPRAVREGASAVLSLGFGNRSRQPLGNS